MKYTNSMLALAFAMLVCAFGTSPAHSQEIPRTLSVQGVLTDAFGKAALEGKHIFRTGIYESPIGGIPLYEQSDTVTLNPGGLYQLALGGLKGLPKSLSFNKAYFIDIVVDGIPQTMRIPLQPAPYALMAVNVAENAIVEENLAKPLREKLFPEKGKDGEGNLANYVGGFRSVIAGGDENRTSANFSSILGGFTNSVSGAYSSVVGGQGNQVMGAYSFVGGGMNNRAMGPYTSVTAGSANTVTSSSSYGSIGGGQSNQVGGNHGTVAGGQSNLVTTQAGTVSGGVSNRAMQTFATVSGGQNNQAGGSGATVSGGISNTVTGQNSVVSGGAQNTVSGAHAVVAGGLRNSASGQLSGIGSGQNNVASGLQSTIAGGSNNKATAINSTISGGSDNEATAQSSTISGGSNNDALSDFTTIGGGRTNIVTSTGQYSTIVGGQSNTINSRHANISGGVANLISQNSHRSMIGGGDSNSIIHTGTINTSNNSIIAGGFKNEINNGNFSVIGGGATNSLDNVEHSLISGGINNDIALNADAAVIVGGTNNNIGKNSAGSSILGGRFNNIGETSLLSAILSGDTNSIANSVDRSIIAGGLRNSISNDGDYSGIFTGRNNIVDGDYSAILGGGGDVIVNRNAITGNNSSILGGSKNVVNGNHGAAIGFNNRAYSDAFALGTGAIAGPNEFAANYSHGFYFKSSGLGDGSTANNSGYDFENHVAVFHNPAGTNGILIKIDNACETADEKVNNDNNFVTFQNIDGDEVGRIEGQTINDFGNDDEYQQELAFAILDVVVASTDVAMKGYQLVSDIMDVGVASSCIFCPQLAVPEAEDVVKDGIELGMSTAGLVSAGFALDNLIKSKKDNVGVTYQSGAGDYAEYLPKLDAKEKFVSGQIVGVKGGLITKNTDNADQLMVISRKPIVLGNATPKAKAEQYEKVAFLGQVPVVVTGSVKLGDYILPDGKHKGLGIAVSPENIKPEQYKQIVGIAWSESNGKIATEINVAVGLNGLSISKEVSRQNDIIAKQDEQITMLKKVLCSMNTAMSKVDASYASTVNSLLGGDANTILDVKPGMAPAHIQTKQVNAKPNPIKIREMMMDDAQAMALYEKARGTGHPTMGTPALFQHFENDPAKKARFIQELKSRYNQSIYEAMGRQSSQR